jgi:hypothetical protein
MNIRLVDKEEEYTPARFSSIDELIEWLEKYKDTLVAFEIYGEEVIKDGESNGHS